VVCSLVSHCERWKPTEMLDRPAFFRPNGYRIVGRAVIRRVASDPRLRRGALLSLRRSGHTLRRCRFHREWR